ncbi:MAG: DUF2179 domain-containing protein [Bacteroidales bacterium]|jgi:uncharacterized protein YebE (UPF0316 family)
MVSSGFFNSDVFAWVVLPLLIFLARICDVSLDTLRLIFVSKGIKKVAPLLGFFEVLIWLLAVSQIMKHLDNAICYIAYGSGFAMGNYIGMILEEKISIGSVMIRVVPKSDTSELVDMLRAQNYGITVVDAEGSHGNVKIIFSVVKRDNIPGFVSIINRYNPQAFYTVEDVRSVNEGVLHNDKKPFSVAFGFLRRKGK